MRKLTSFIMLLTLIFPLLYTLSCTKKQPVKPKTGKQIQSQTKKQKNKKIILSETPKPVKKSINKAIPTTGGINFLKDKSGEFITPSDFKIGKLQREFNLTREQIAQLKIIKSFLSGLTGGKVEKDTLIDSERDNLEKIIKYRLNREGVPIYFRIGEILKNRSRDLTSANVKLIGKRGVAEGEIYLKKQKNQWFIENVKIDFSMLNKPSKEEGQEPFNPSRFEWMLKDMN